MTTRSFHIAAGAVLCLQALAVGGCEILPASGPANMDIRAAQKDPESLPYALVKIRPEIVDVAGRTPRLSAAFVDRRSPKEIRFGVGDVLSVTVFEAAAGGLFIPVDAGVRPGNFVSIPNQTVDSAGNITVPYAGAIRAKGKTAPQVQAAIVEALRNRAVEPQILVTLAQQQTSLISVLGEVNAPARFPANAAGERLLDVIARAGGPKGQGFDTFVMLERNGRRATVPFGALVSDPMNNIYAHPEDTIYLYREPQTFVAFGASGRQGQLPFDAWRISLAEAVAKAGGLNDDKADPAAVFLYRGETRQTAEALGIDCARFNGPIIPVVYIADFREPAEYFLATKFDMRNKDVIYVSNAFAVESAKAIQYFRLLTATMNDPIVSATNALVLRGVATQGLTGGVGVVTTSVQ